MTAVLAVLTWNRFNALSTFISGLERSCPQYRLGVFEDAGTRDNTVGQMVHSAKAQGLSLRDRPDYAAAEFTSEDTAVFLGTENLGVAGNSNRALRWFMTETTADVLCLCNDDLIVTGDFPALYTEAMRRTNVGLFCFCGFTSPQYSYTPLAESGCELKSLHRMTGAMMAISRSLVERIGYFDTRFGKFGEEHCHYTSRAKLAGFQSLPSSGIHTCLDVESVDGEKVASRLAHAEVPSTMQGEEKAAADTIATAAVATINYAVDGLYCPYALRKKPAMVAGIDNCGTPESSLTGYYNVVTRQTVI